MVVALTMFPASYLVTSRVDIVRVWLSTESVASSRRNCSTDPIVQLRTLTPSLPTRRKLISQAAQETSRPWRVLLVDQRNHGKSGHLPGFNPPHTLASSAADIAALFDDVLGGRPLHAMLGHSLGGKVALSYLRQAAESQQSQAQMVLPNQVWVLDSMVGQAKLCEEEPQDVHRVIQEVRNIPVPVPSREWLYDHLKSQGFSEGLQLWLGSSLVSRERGLEWTFNIEGAADMYEDYQSQEFWDVVSSPPEPVKLHLVRAANSDRWSKPSITRLQQAVGRSAGASTTHLLPNAGHWLHMDNPEGLLKLVLSQLCKMT
ncbi:hypothetical protein WJX74_008474 [Apatococcus lobatus]|uniref:AB hydrolase-1 domain-containing protein n=1 Tax=Apatococcus lobatus TaxID=904363 RepID=A0AAW1RXV7_9CHLO